MLHALAGPASARSLGLEALLVDEATLSYRFVVLRRAETGRVVQDRVSKSVYCSFYAGATGSCSTRMPTTHACSRISRSRRCFASPFQQKHISSQAKLQPVSDQAAAEIYTVVLVVHPSGSSRGSTRAWPARGEVKKISKR